MNPRSVFLHILLAVVSLAPACADLFQPSETTAALWEFGDLENGRVPDKVGALELVFDKAADQDISEKVEGKFGRALHLPGTVALTSRKPANLQVTDAVTLEAWIKLDSEGDGQQRGLFEIRKGGESGFRMGISKNGRLAWMIQDGTKEVVVYGNTKLPFDEWIHVAGTYDGSVMTIYLNGQPDGTRELAGGKPFGEGNILVGLISAEGPPFFRGSIEAIRVSSSALTQFP